MEMPVLFALAAAKNSTMYIHSLFKYLLQDQFDLNQSTNPTLEALTDMKYKRFQISISR